MTSKLPIENAPIIKEIKVIAATNIRITPINLPIILNIVRIIVPKVSKKSCKPELAFLLPFLIWQLLIFLQVYQPKIKINKILNTMQNATIPYRNELSFQGTRPGSEEYFIDGMRVMGTANISTSSISPVFDIRTEVTRSPSSPFLRASSGYSTFSYRILRYDSSDCPGRIRGE